MAVDVLIGMLFPVNSPFPGVYSGYFPDNFGSLITVSKNIMAVSVYQGGVAELVQWAKVYGETAIATEMADIMIAIMGSQGCEYDYIACVPADPHRSIERGYHIPEKIARHISTVTKIPYISLVSKVRHTPSQTSLNKQQRADNVKHVFSSIKIPLKSNEEVTKILLVDDTVTTGSTLSAVKKVIRNQNPAATVTCLAFTAAV